MSLPLIKKDFPEKERPLAVVKKYPTQKGMAGEIKKYFTHPDKNQFIVSPTYDNVWFIFSPLIAIGIGFLMTMDFFRQPLTLGTNTNPLSYFLYMILTQGHLASTVARSHLNNNVFREYPIRFVLLPLGLFMLFFSSPWAFTVGFVLMTFWDVYHSSMQTFGLGRIYDAKAGNHALVGRRLDMMLNLLMYAGPVFAGSLLISHLNSFERFQKLSPWQWGPLVIDNMFFSQIPARVAAHENLLRNIFLAVCLPAVTLYIFKYWQYHKQGYKFSKQKVFLLVNTTLCSLWSWYFNVWGMAFLIINLFHAVQYFALVWSTENKNLAQLFKIHTESRKKPWLLAGFLLLPCAYGLYSISSGSEFANVSLVICALMHFYYDGFIWSVRKQQHLARN